ncbi:hypothetical protein, partial [Acinetobacter baumannii]|uniref:hypothetical protein n=1 Tax=Acinetobacter baumannii TaxID=470 RepID=UPI0020911319
GQLAGDPLRLRLDQRQQRIEMVRRGLRQAGQGCQAGLRPGQAQRAVQAGPAHPQGAGADHPDRPLHRVPADEQVGA